MTGKPSSKGYYSPIQPPLTSRTSSMVASLHPSSLNPPPSAPYRTSHLRPSCTNHKRRKAGYVVGLEEGEVIYFCEKCMELAGKQGFGGKKVEEFHGSLRNKQSKGEWEQREKTERTSNLNHYLDRLKDFYEEIGNFKETIESSLNECVNSNQIYRLFQRFQKELHSLKDAYDRELVLKQQLSTRLCQQIACKVVWNQEDLQHMISRICKNYDRLMREMPGEFAIDLKLMNERLQEKKTSLVRMEERFEGWKKDDQSAIYSLNDQYRSRLHRLWDDLILDRSISKISLLQSSGRSLSPYSCKIIQQLSTTSNNSFLK